MDLLVWGRLQIEVLVGCLNTRLLTTPSADPAKGVESFMVLRKGAAYQIERA